jgi:hypothetical protein
VAAVSYELGGLLSFGEVAFSSSEVTFSSMAESVAAVYQERDNNLFSSSEGVLSSMAELAAWW